MLDQYLSIGIDLDGAVDPLTWLPTICALGFEQQGHYSATFLWNWMARHGLTLDAAAQALGVSRRMLAYYRSGKHPLPRTVALARLGWEAHPGAIQPRFVVAL